MLDLVTDRWVRNCQGTTRRELLEVGALGLGGLTLSSLLSMRAQAATTGRVVKDRSVVLLFLTGGVSQIETFDPKMSAPSEYRSVTGEVATSIPGVTFGGTCSRMARRAHRMALVRSFTHGESDHTKAVQRVIRGANPAKAGMGVVLSRLRGANHPVTGIPTHIHLNHDEVDRQFNKEKLRLLEADGPGDFGAALGPFRPGVGGDASENMKLGIPRIRLDDRRGLLAALDRLERQIDARGEMAAFDRFEGKAFDLILGKARSAFDLSREDPRVVERYDTSSFRTGLSKYSTSSLGQQLLLARRLCEAGCGFVTVHNPGWDMHGGPRQYAMKKGMEGLGRPVDHAVSAFMEDVEQRGLSDTILLVITGEFGRTPKVNKNGGRDHWPRLSTLAFVGGGLRMGQVVGQSTARAEAPLSGPVTIEDMLATILHVLLDVTTLRQAAVLPNNVASILERGEPIPELV